MKRIDQSRALRRLCFSIVVLCGISALAGTTAVQKEELQAVNVTGTFGGRLTTSLRSDPKTFNPVTAVDTASVEVISQMNADLVHINRATQRIEPALAKSWNVSRDGLTYTFHLRQGIRFSDGVPFNADDVVFSFERYLNESQNSPQRDVLTIDGKPVAVKKIDRFTVAFHLATPCASGERLFDSVAILPRHLLQANASSSASAWNTSTAPSEIAGLGPFRLKEYKPGQYVTLERNPFYWKADNHGQRLPYLSELSFLLVPSEEAEVMRFAGGETDVINRIGAGNFVSLSSGYDKNEMALRDLGSSLEYNFLLFNLNSDVPAESQNLRAKQAWFTNLAFRRAVSLAIDRRGMSKIVYHALGTLLSTHITPGNVEWNDLAQGYPTRSVAKARETLKAAGFWWRPDGTLISPADTTVEFTIIASASSPERTQMATLIQQDLGEIGMQVHVAPLEFRSLLDRVLHTHDYDAAIMGLGRGDADPNSQMNVWMSSGDMHLWNLGEKHPKNWEAEMDVLLNRQFHTLDPKQRKQIFLQTLKLEADNLPIICLVSPNVLVGARSRVMNFHPAVMDSHTLWNAEVLYLSDNAQVGRR